MAEDQEQTAAEWDDEPEDLDKWRAGYDLLAKNPPQEGDYLYAKNGPIRIEIECTRGREPFVFGRAYLPLMVGDPLRWYAQGLDDEASVYGYRLILTNKSKFEIIRRYGMTNPVASVKSLKVLNISASGKSLIVEVVEF